ncbi:MAG: type II secretion system protein GspN, partial [Deltaproteobacteria bacterium]|nr:type II secretion system protein GspN [Deltaproteobacteria bacterium]
YDLLKDRLTAEIEKQMGGNVSVNASSFRPYWFTGVKIKKLSIARDEAGISKKLLDVDELKGRLALLPAVFGSYRGSFFIRVGKGEIEGSIAKVEEGFEIDVDLDDVDLGALPIFLAEYGMKLKSQIKGNVQLRFDQQNFVRSAGKANLDFSSLQMEPSEVMIAGQAMPLPELVFAKGKNSRVNINIDKGVFSLDEFKFSGGDISADIKGKIFLASEFSNWRFNLIGTFSDSPKLSQSLPFLFLIEKQKQASGSYPLAVTGRVSKPTIKIGEFTLPL